MTIAIVLIQHTLECRPGIFENVVVQEHIALFHGDQAVLRRECFDVTGCWSRDVTKLTDGGAVN